MVTSLQVTKVLLWQRRKGILVFQVPKPKYCLALFISGTEAGAMPEGGRLP